MNRALCITSFLLFILALAFQAKTAPLPLDSPAYLSKGAAGYGWYQPTGSMTRTPGVGIPLSVDYQGRVILAPGQNINITLPTATYTPSFTWNATTTRTQPPTPTPTATNTPVIVAEQSRCMKQADGYTTTCSSVAPAASPVATVLPVPSPGYYWKYELSSMNVGTATGRRTMTKGGTACTESQPPLSMFRWCENGALNGAVTLGWIYDAGVTFRDTLKAAQLPGGR